MDQRLRRQKLDVAEVGDVAHIAHACLPFTHQLEWDTQKRTLAAILLTILLMSVYGHYQAEAGSFAGSKNPTVITRWDECSDGSHSVLCSVPHV